MIIMNQQELVDKLLVAYKNLFTEQSALGLLYWAQNKLSSPETIVSPTIPFVGKNYLAQSTKVLLYASAENLSNYSDPKKGGWLDNDEVAINRHRRWYNCSAEKKFFPNVHIAPISDGSLLIVLRYICEKLGIDMPTTPKEFMEAIAFANFGKFSIRTKSSNIDYPKDIEKLDCSMPYIKNDLEILKPDIIVMFKTMYSTQRLKIDAAKGEAKIIGITQINARTVNTNLRKYYDLKNEEDLSQVIRDWYDIRNFHENKFKNRTHHNFLSVFTYLDNLPDLR